VPIAKGVERDGEHVIRLVIRQVMEKEVDVTIEGIDQPRPACELIHQTDAAVVGGHIAFEQLTATVVNLVRLNHWWAVRPVAKTRCSRFGALAQAV
jgi:hypothetical protein